MGRTLYVTNNTVLSNFSMSPADAWLGAPNGVESWSNTNAYASAVKITGDQFGFNLPEGAIVNSVKVMFTATRNNGQSIFEMFAPNGTTVLESITGVTRNVAKTSTRTYTREEINALSIRWTSPNTVDYAVIDAFTIDVDWTDTRNMATRQAIQYATTYVDAQTDFFETTAEANYVAGGKFLGAPDGVYATHSASVASAFTLGVGMGAFELPAGARIDAVHFGIYTRAKGTLNLYSDNSFSASALLGQIAVNSVDTFATLTAPPSLTAINGAKYMKMNFNGTDTKQVDAFVVWVDYAVPVTGPVVKKFVGGTWQNTSFVRRLGTDNVWRIATITKL